ncbi:response regulator transcription factor [Rhizobium ruizarguesonis]|uniref:response regulator transcription factor n=1 Tax=Rhizobium ruizarguesonis TaxID=2081791 RepID=UPI0010302B4E|nr:LuxR C-terminal-related transcriptional regulator [Rhizobium ruizarguesonis]TAZ35437.1 response regulator transcription factor [Rhizobium ruizarguesonis]
MYNPDLIHGAPRTVKADQQEAPVVFVVSDDNAINQLLGSRASSQGWQTTIYGSATEFFASESITNCGCVVLDAGLPDLTGSALTRLIRLSAARLPVILLTAPGDPAMTIEATKFHFTFTPKPSDVTGLVDQISSAIGTSIKTSGLESRYRTLSLRERQVMGFVVEGLLNKQVAYRLNISEITVKAHRGKVMRKMSARTLPELVNMAAKIELDLQPVH